MRATCVNMVYELAKKDERVVFIGSDLSPGLLAGMKKDYPDRYYMEGVTEANVIGMAAGMALEGFVPYVNTIATFITRRCYEQVAVDLCLHDLPVRLIGNGGGFVYAPLGPTHQAIEDIAIMRALPNMTVVVPADAEEMRRFMAITLDWPHPIYIRLAKGGDEVVTKPEHGFAIGKAILLREASGGRHGPVLLIGTGVGTTQALHAAELLAADGIACHVLHMPTVKPLDVAMLEKLASQCAARGHGRGAHRDRRARQRGDRRAGRAHGRARPAPAPDRHSGRVRQGLRQPGMADGRFRHPRAADRRLRAQGDRILSPPAKRGG